MASQKRKRSVQEDESLLYETERTAFEAAFSVLDYEKLNDANSIPHAKKQRVDNDKPQHQDNTEPPLVDKREVANRNNARDVSLYEPSRIRQWLQQRNAQTQTSFNRQDGHHGTFATYNDTSTTVGGRVEQQQQQQVVDPSVTMRHEKAIAILRIQLVIVQHKENDPVELEQLPRLYQDAFGECLDHCSFGYNTLESFVETIPFVHMHNYGLNLRLLTISPLLMPSLAPSNATEDAPIHRDEMDEPSLTLEDSIDKNEQSIEKNVNRLPDVGNQIDSKETSHCPPTSNEIANEDDGNVGEPLFVLDYQGSTTNEDDAYSLNETILTEQDPCDAVVAMVEKEKEPQQASLEDVQGRIYQLVSLHAPVAMHDLQSLYLDSFATPLDHKSLGFKRLKLLVQSIPSINIEVIRFGDCLLLSLAETSQQDSSAASHFPTKNVTTKQEQRGGVKRKQLLSKKQRSQRREKVDEAKRRIQFLVSRHAPIKLYSLKSWYKKTFHEPLDFKSLGYKKFKPLVIQAIEPIGMTFQGKSTLIVASSQPPLKSEQPTQPLLPSSSASLQPSDPHSYYGPQPEQPKSSSTNNATGARVPENDQQVSTSSDKEPTDGAIVPESVAPLSSLGSKDDDEARAPKQTSSSDVESMTKLSQYDRKASRLVELVATHERNNSMPLELTSVPEMYKIKFGGQHLYVRWLGFSNLEQFVESVPSLFLCRGTLNGKRTITIHTKKTTSS